MKKIVIGGIILLITLSITNCHSKNKIKHENRLQQIEDERLERQKERDSIIPPVIKGQYTEKNPSINYNRFNSRLNAYRSESYKIEITSIDVELKNNIVEIKDNSLYSVPRNEDGYILSVKYSITNPYNKKMRIPFDRHGGHTINFFDTNGNPSYVQPKNYIITSGAFSNSGDEHSDRIVNEQGEEWYNFTVNGESINFDANETKKFIIQFDKPIYTKINKILFGFATSPSRYYSDEYWPFNSCDPDNDIGLVIDLQERKIIGKWIAGNEECDYMDYKILNDLRVNYNNKMF